MRDRRNLLLYTHGVQEIRLKDRARCLPFAALRISCSAALEILRFDSERRMHFFGQRSQLQHTSTVTAPGACQFRDSDLGRFMISVAETEGFEPSVRVIPVRRF